VGDNGPKSMELANRKVSKTFSMQNFKEGASNANHEGVEMKGTQERGALVSSQKSELLTHKIEDS